MGRTTFGVSNDTRIRVSAIVISTLTLMHWQNSLANAVAPVAPSLVPGKEYSNHRDETAGGTADSEQAIAWDGIGGASNTFDYTPGAPGPVRDPNMGNSTETDALAHDNDVFFNEVRGNQVPLVFSTDRDDRILFEQTNGTGGVWATAATINSTSPPDDVDAIELWGPDADDAFNYSLESPNAVPPLPSDPGGFAVWHVPGSSPGSLGGTAYPLLTDSQLAGAIIGLAPEGTNVGLLAEFLNLDAMMLDITRFEPGGSSGVQIGSIIFSIDPIDDLASGATIFDGGEIFTWDFDSTNPAVPATFLRHGGHLWNTAFDVQGTFGSASENVNGIEAVSPIPEPSTIVLSVIALAAMAFVWNGSLGKVTVHRPLVSVEFVASERRIAERRMAAMVGVRPDCIPQLKSESC